MGKPTWMGSSRAEQRGLCPAQLCEDAHTPKTTQGAGYVMSEGLLLSCWEHWRWHTDKQSTAEICGTGSTGQTQRHRSQA